MLGGGIKMDTQLFVYPLKSLIEIKFHLKAKIVGLLKDKCIQSSMNRKTEKSLSMM